MSPDSTLPASSFEPAPPPAARLGRWTLADAAKLGPLTTIAIGVLAPPILFKVDNSLMGELMDGGIAPFRPYSTIWMSLSVVLLLLWYPLRRREHWSQALFVGPLLLGGVISLSIGLYLLPFALAGIQLAGIGLLGLIPLWTSYVYFRAAALAHLAARTRLSVLTACSFAVLSALVVGAGVLGAGSAAERFAHEQVLILIGERSGDRAQAESALAKLYAFPQVRLSRLRAAARAEAYEASMSDPPPPRPIATVYGRITGLKIRSD